MKWLIGWMVLAFSCLLLTLNYAQDTPQTSKPVGESTVVETIEQRATKIVDLVRGKPTSDKMVREIVSGFVISYAKQGDKNAPINGDFKAQAEYYLAIMSATHSGAYSTKKQFDAANAANQAANKEFQE